MSTTNAGHNNRSAAATARSKPPPFSPVPRPPLLRPRLMTPGTAPLATTADAAAPVTIATTNAAPRCASIVVAQCSQGRARVDARRCHHLPCDYSRSTPESGRHGHIAVIAVVSVRTAEREVYSDVREPPKRLKNRVYKDVEAVYTRDGSRSCGA